MAKPSVAKICADVTDADVFMPADWREWDGAEPRYYILDPPRQSKTDIRAARRMQRQKKGGWSPCSNGEQSFFPPTEPVLVVAQHG